jgi:hypothetical protein
MKNTQRFLIAKYTPDARRAEPRNFGIILWATGRAHSQFLAADDAYFIRDKRTYRRWVAYWESLVSEGKVSLPRKPLATIDRPEFLDAVRETQEGNYLLWEGGQVVSAVGRRGLPAATAQLFSDLVVRNAPEPEGHKEQTARLKAECDRTLAAAGISARDDFKQSYRVSCRVRDVDWPITFNYAIVNGHIGAAFQRVNIAAQQSVNSAAFVYEQMLNTQTLTKERCVAMVKVDALHSRHGPDPDESIGRLEAFATVINIADARATREKLREIGEAA